MLLFTFGNLRLFDFFAVEVLNEFLEVIYQLNLLRKKEIH